MSNYPDGVTDAHPYFNPQEGTCRVACTADEVPGLPYFAVKNEVEQLHRTLDDLSKSGWAVSNKDARAIVEKLGALSADLDKWKLDDVNYECEWEGEVDTDISEEAEWRCPRCGRDNVTDTLPEDRDPDEGWDRDR
jgi:hypothetical protein